MTESGLSFVFTNFKKQMKMICGVRWFFEITRKFCNIGTVKMISIDFFV